MYTIMQASAQDAFQPILRPTSAELGHLHVGDGECYNLVVCLTHVEDLMYMSNQQTQPISLFKPPVKPSP